MNDLTKECVYIIENKYNTTLSDAEVSLIMETISVLNEGLGTFVKNFSGGLNKTIQNSFLNRGVFRQASDWLAGNGKHVSAAGKKFKADTLAKNTDYQAALKKMEGLAPNSPELKAAETELSAIRKKILGSDQYKNSLRTALGDARNEAAFKRGAGTLAAGGAAYLGANMLF